MTLLSCASIAIEDFFFLNEQFTPISIYALFIWFMDETALCVSWERLLSVLTPTLLLR